MDPCGKASAHDLADYLALTRESIESFAARAGTHPAVVRGVLEGRGSPDLVVARRIAAASGGAIDPAKVMSAKPSVIFGTSFGAPQAIDDRLLAAVIEVIAPQVFSPECREAAFAAAAAADIFEALSDVSALSQTDRLAEALRPALRESFARSPGCGDPDRAAFQSARLYLAAQSRLST
jgi:hypothetical protein